MPSPEPHATDDWLRPGVYVDSDHPIVAGFTAEVTAGCQGEVERARALFRAVRERLRYDPYAVSPDPRDLKASAILGKDRAFCIPKAVVLCAAARAAGIPARLGFADVKNHLASEKLVRRLGTDLFVWHGYVELFVGGRVLKASPAFNASLCERFGVPVLDFDGTADAMLHAFDSSGRRHMEYVRDRGTYLDLPRDAIFTTFAELYGGVAPTAGDHDEAFHGA